MKWNFLADTHPPRINPHFQNAHLFSSLVFERAHGWQGLLVEPHPVIFAKVLNCSALKNTNCKICRGCLCRGRLGVWLHV